MEIRVKAPATSANLGPGFDCAGVALELWNELAVEEADALEVEVDGEGADEAPRDETHLGLRAFALVEPVAGKRFRFRNRIPFARGLGSSSATIALGLVAATRWQGREPDADELLPLAMQLEPHADNLAPCLLGGAVLAWEEGERWRARRVADDAPARRDRDRPAAPCRDGGRASRAPRRAVPCGRGLFGRARRPPRRRARQRRPRAPQGGVPRQAPRAVPRGERAAPARDPRRPADGRGRRDALRLGPDRDRVGLSRLGRELPWTSS